jgi:hypothetical protein
MTLPVHPLAELFPLIDGEDFSAFAEDIRLNGVVDKIVLLDGAILDGRNRFNVLTHLVESGEVLGSGWGHRAGEPLDAEHLDADNPWFCRFNRDVDGDPLSWVLSKNLKRRHLNESQRAMVAAKLKTMKLGDNQHRQGPPIGGPSIEPLPVYVPPVGGISAQAAAKLLNVGARSVERASSVLNDGTAEVQHAVEQGKLAVSAAEKIARLPSAEQPEALAKVLPSGHRAIMGSRIEPADSLDFFPTPPWATRALIEHVLPRLDVVPAEYSAWEPACGEGHIAEVLAEYFPKVGASDIHDYGYGAAYDFLCDDGWRRHDWIITNPPFGDKTEAFVLKALREAAYGVAMFVRLQWLETVGRYETIFRKHPPTMIAFFAERVPLCKGRWNPAGDTATAYVWLVWSRYHAPQPPFWIPPGCRDALTRADDIERFTVRPVTKAIHAVTDSPAKANADLAATEGAPAPATEGMDSAASRLADGRTSDLAGGDGASASLPAGEFDDEPLFGEEERTIWKALSALDAGLTIEGPILDVLLRDGLIMTGAVDCGYLLTTRGLSTLGMYDAHFNPPVDGLSTDELQALNGIPGEGASGTAREAPSAGSGDVDLQSASGTPHDSSDTDAPGCTAASAGGAAPAPAAPPEPEPLDIPAFLKRRPDNSLPPRDASEAA